MDLAKLIEHEDAVKKVIDPLPQIEKLIARNYLQTLLGLNSEETTRAIEREYRKELEPRG